jgi:hypothetical protein
MKNFRRKDADHTYRHSPGLPCEIRLPSHTRMGSFVAHYLSDLVETRNTLQEEPRLQVCRNVPHADLVLNPDKVRISESENRQPNKVVIGTTFAGETVHNGRSRNLKHISIMPCMDMVTSPVTERVRTRLGATGTCRGTLFPVKTTDPRQNPRTVIGIPSILIGTGSNPQK